MNTYVKLEIKLNYISDERAEDIKFLIHNQQTTDKWSEGNYMLNDMVVIIKEDKIKVIEL